MNRRHTNEQIGVIETGKAYTMAEFCRRLDIGKHAWRSMKRRGLPVRRIAGRAFVRGDDALAFLATLGDGDAGSEA